MSDNSNNMSDKKMSILCFPIVLRSDAARHSQAMIMNMEEKNLTFVDQSNKSYSCYFKCHVYMVESLYREIPPLLVKFGPI